MKDRQRHSRAGTAIVRAAASVIGHARDARVEPLESRTLLAGDTVLPTAKLAASAPAAYAPSYTFKVVYTDDQGIKLTTIDSKDIAVTGPNGYSRKAKLVSTSSSNGGKTVTARYKLQTPGVIWDADDNGTYSFKLLGNQVTDKSGNGVRGKVIGKVAFNAPVLPSESKTDSGSKITPTSSVVDVRNFGAIANDGIDDTNAIQAAIDSLPRGNAIPDAVQLVGGTVYLPAGTWDVSKPLRISSSVVLQGQGSGTVLNSTSSDGSSPVVQLTSYAGNGFVIHAAVQDLSIQTTSAKAVAVDQNIAGDVIGLELSGLTISAGGAAIDLRGKDVYQSTLRNLTINNPGSTAIWMDVGKSDGNTAINRVSNVVVQGTARANFKAERAMVSLTGDFTVDGLRIADTGAKVTPLYVSRSANFRNLSLPAAGTNLPGGVLVNIADATHVSFDQLTNMGPSRWLKLTNSWDVQVAELNLADGATLAAAASVDKGSHLSVGALSGGEAGAITRGRVRLGSIVTPTGDTKSATINGALAPDTVELGAVSTLSVNVSAFNAKPNDGIDDTAAIQAAIDSLPRGDGLPGGATAVGGTIVLGRGVYNTSSALRVPSGVWIKGQGDSTIIRNGSTDANGTTISLVSGAASGTNSGSGIADLALYTASAAGIRADGSSITNSLVDLQLSNLTISAGGAGIDLRAVRTYHASITEIGFVAAGSTALWLGDDAGYSADNRVAGLQTYGQMRSNFRAERALFVFEGQNQIDTVWIEQANADVLPVYVTGSADIRGMWLEYPYDHLPNHVMASFVNTTSVTIDRLMAVDDLRKLQFRNSPNVSIGGLSIFSREAPLAQTLDLDAASHVNIGTVAAKRDAGMLDSPQVTVGGTFSLSTLTYVDTATALGGKNLLNDMQDWTIQWGDTLGKVTGTQSIEQTPDGPRLRIEITSNPNGRSVAVMAKVNVDASSAGKQAAARYRIDGPGTAVVYTSGYAQQYTSRAMNTLTTTPVPGALKAGDQMIFVLPATTGVFYISNAGIVVNE